jgi:hypothetical protein
MDDNVDFGGDRKLPGEEKGKNAQKEISTKLAEASDMNRRKLNRLMRMHLCLHTYVF